MPRRWLFLALMALCLIGRLPVGAIAQDRHPLNREDVGLIHPLAYGSALNATTLNAAISAASTNGKTLMLSCGTWTLATNVTTPRTLTLYVPACATVSVNTGITLTLNGPYRVEEPVWYSGAGTVTLGTLTGTGMDNTHGRADDVLRELHASLGDALRPFVASGCLPTVPSSSLTLGAFACKGWVRGASQELVYVDQGAAAVGPLSS